MTKEEMKFNVILASSDSFVHNWLSNLVGLDRLETFVVGNLSKREANEYWDTEVTCNGFNGRDAISFKEIFEICGGKMFLLQRLYRNYVIYGIHPSKSPYITQACMHLVKAMSPCNQFYRDPLKAHRLACADGGYLYHKDLLDKVAQDALDSLIEYNILHTRPYFPLCKDLDPVPVKSGNVVTTESPVGLYAMKLISKQFSK